MFLAPLNNSRFFRKVFSRKHIAKQFIEDFLDLTISDIKQLKDKNRLTDKSIRVELDFECTIGNAVVIVDMQQWFKTDRVQRFYTYHTVDTELHLDDCQGLFFRPSFVPSSFNSIFAPSSNRHLTVPDHIYQAEMYRDELVEAVLQHRHIQVIVVDVFKKIIVKWIK